MKGKKFNDWLNEDWLSRKGSSSWSN